MGTVQTYNKIPLPLYNTGRLNHRRTHAVMQPPTNSITAVQHVPNMFGEPVRLSWSIPEVLFSGAALYSWRCFISGSERLDPFWMTGWSSRPLIHWPLTSTFGKTIHHREWQIRYHMTHMMTHSECTCTQATQLHWRCVFTTLTRGWITSAIKGIV